MRYKLLTPSQAIFRGAVCLASGFIFTFLVPIGLETVWPYFQDEHFRASPFAIWLVRILNLPAVIYCIFFSLPDALPKGDESLYCLATTFYFNTLYYAAALFAGWHLVKCHAR